MMIYPDIGLKQGRCVTLRRGQMVLPLRHRCEPVEQARRFAAEGAEWINVVDLDAKGRRVRDNTELMARIVQEAGVPVQVGGGILKPAHVDWWMARGAASVTIGSAAVLSPRLVAEACARHPFGITLAIEVRDGRVMVDGWTEPSDHDPLQFARQFDGLALAGIVLTDLDHDPEFPEASLARALAFAEGLQTPVSVAGMVRSLDDIATLCELGGFAGAVIGRPLHAGTFTLAEAVSAARTKGGEPEAAGGLVAVA